MSTTVTKLNYIEGLDGIRALAALLVVSTHWPTNLLSLKFGWIGVNIFFVLSGFLITRILVNNKDRSLKAYLGDFFYKRALRIFPVYYLVIGFITVLLLALSVGIPQLSNDKTIQYGVNAIKTDWPYYLTYTYNIKLNLSYFFAGKSFSTPFFGHLWSLSVEEQFYIVFPFIVYFLNLPALKKFVIGIIIICPLIRLWAAVYGTNMVTDRFWLGELIYTNTLCQADALAMGAAMAIFPFSVRFPYRNFFIIAFTWLTVGLICFYFLRKAGYFLVEGKSVGYNFPGYWFEQVTPYFLINLRVVYQYTLVNLLAVVLIAPAIAGKPLFPFLFNAKPVKYLGKISYGIYLIHSPLIGFFLAGMAFFGNWTAIANPLVQLAIFLSYLIILILFAHLSYKYFEQRILSRYRHSYDKH